MKMLLRAAALAAALAVSGCLVTDDALYPTDGGAEVDMRQGNYECFDTDDDRPWNAMIAEVKTNMRVTYVHADRFATWLVSLHPVGKKTYIAVTPKSGKYGQIIGIIRLTGDSSYERIRLTKEAVEAEAKGRGIAVEEMNGTDYSIRGGTKERRDLIEALAKKADTLPVAYRCAYKAKQD